MKEIGIEYKLTASGSKRVNMKAEEVGNNLEEVVCRIIHMVPWHSLHLYDVR